MRILAWTFFVGALISASAPVAAQTYDPRYPVCLQRWVWGGSTYFECHFNSWDQCQAAGAGLPAMCVDNPYWHPGPRSPRGRR